MPSTTSGAAAGGPTPPRAAPAPLDALTADNSALFLIDYQERMYKGVGDRDRNQMHRAAVAAAKAAAIMEIPTVLTLINAQWNGDFNAEVAAPFPGQEVIARTVPGFDALADPAVDAALRATGRRKIVLSGLWTSICMSFTALHVLREGYEVYGIVDAAGDVSREAHDTGVTRMAQAGVVPLTWMPLVSEWMADWSNPASGALHDQVYATYDIMMSMP
ncbi:isochorismatase family protein [Streptomyces sp. NPDC048659]|uniref:isochorismatase family protein n=1 Tax=Streptomyces sp. NPDC048659 TaxID=3155489 RepID=UPI00342F2964